MEVSPVLSCLMHSSAQFSAHNGRLITLTLPRTHTLQGHDHVTTSRTRVNYMQQCSHNQAQMFFTATPRSAFGLAGSSAACRRQKNEGDACPVWTEAPSAGFPLTADFISFGCCYEQTFGDRCTLMLWMPAVGAEQATNGWI